MPSTCRTTTEKYEMQYREQALYNNYNSLGRSLQNSAREEKSSFANIYDVQAAASNQQSALFSFREATQKTFRSLLDLLLRTNKELKNPEAYGSRTLNLMKESSLSLDFLSSGSTWNRVTEEQYSMQEKECTTFSGTGTAVTADGRTIDFGVSFSLSREFQMAYDMTSMEQFERVLTDPLVINLDSNPASLSDQTFFFDINGDGKEEEISMLAGSSGFLALDKNGDGVINDGRELFGTRTGNGFGELSAYDKDGNGWIDEADEVFDKLKVWVKDEQGKDRLLSLKECGVGAIYLGSRQSQFTLKDNENNINAVIRSTGMFLFESGKSGTVQQLDFADHQYV